MGMLDWIDHDPGRFYFYLIPCALLFLAAGWVFEEPRKIRIREPKSMTGWKRR